MAKAGDALLIIQRRGEHKEYTKTDERLFKFCGQLGKEIFVREV